jgi:hypothetical protein
MSIMHMQRRQQQQGWQEKGKNGNMEGGHM